MSEQPHGIGSIADALILVDLQNDFMEDGAQPVRDSSELIPLANALMPRFRCVVATQRWHEEDGADFVHGLHIERFDAVIRRGESPTAEGGSGFVDPVEGRPTDLKATLHEHGVRRVFLVGVTTEHAVKLTALDAVRAGLDAVVLTDGCRGMNAEAIRRSGHEMTAAGVSLMESSRLLES